VVLVTPPTSPGSHSLATLSLRKRTERVNAISPRPSMIPFETLTAAWRAERAHRLARYARAPSLGADGLLLGPMTIVAKRVADRWGVPILEIDGCEKRVLSLLAVAYWRPVRPFVIDQLRHVSKVLSGRNPGLAPILISQAGSYRRRRTHRLPPVRDRASARCGREPVRADEGSRPRSLGARCLRQIFAGPAARASRAGRWR